MPEAVNQRSRTLYLLYLTRAIYGQHQVSSIAFVFGLTDGRLLTVPLSDPFVAGVLSEKAVIILSEGLQTSRFANFEGTLMGTVSGTQVCPNARALQGQSWLWKSGQQDKWSFCLKAASMRAAQEKQ